MARRCGTTIYTVSRGWQSTNDWPMNFSCIVNVDSTLYLTVLFRLFRPYSSQRFCRCPAVCSSLGNEYSEENMGYAVVTWEPRPDREYLETDNRHSRRIVSPRVRNGPDFPRGIHRCAYPTHDGHLHQCLLLSQADALPDLPALRRHLRALLPQAHALPNVPALRWHLRTLLLQTDALPMPPGRSA
jgi:hypothetical protein